MKQLGKVKLTDEIIETIDIDNLSTDISAVNENVNRLSDEVNSELTLFKDEIQTTLDNIDFTIDHLSSIGNNEISDYVKNNTYSVSIGIESITKGGDNINIGGSSKSQSNGAIAIGRYSNAAKTHSVSIGASSQAAGNNSIAIGGLAYVNYNISSACQIGIGHNTQVSSLQFLNTTVVNSDGKIPTKSLELKTTIINALSDIQSITSFDSSAIQTIVTVLSNLYSAINS